MSSPMDRPSQLTARLSGYVYRRPLEPRELVPAVAIGIVGGLAAFYVARLFLERTPLEPDQRRTGKRYGMGRPTE
ncbi:MAG: hypothetical protein H0W68_01830 [Gemmatimonadaceae bacterium]|nr:hypothetical protein [Gemmatimonadaceae bacterium]